MGDSHGENTNYIPGLQRVLSEFYKTSARDKENLILEALKAVSHHIEIIREKIIATASYNLKKDLKGFDITKEKIILNPDEYNILLEIMKNINQEPDKKE